MNVRFCKKSFGATACLSVLFSFLFQWKSIATEPSELPKQGGANVVQYNKARIMVLPVPTVVERLPVKTRDRNKKPDQPPLVQEADVVRLNAEMLSAILPADQYELIPLERVVLSSASRTPMEVILLGQSELKLKGVVLVGLRAKQTLTDVPRKRGRRTVMVKESFWNYTIEGRIQDIPAQAGDIPRIQEGFVVALSGEQAKIVRQPRGRRAFVQKLSLENLEPIGERIARLVQSNLKPEVVSPPSLPQAVVVQAPPAVVAPPVVVAPTTVRDQAKDEEDPLLELRNRPVFVSSRPAWRPAFFLEAGYAFFGRSLTANGGVPVLPMTAGGPTESRVGANGFEVAAGLYPFAFSTAVPRQLAGLGLRGGFMRPSWANIMHDHYSQPDPMDPNMPDKSSPRVVTPYAVTDYRAEASLFWRTSFFMKAWRPEFTLGAVYLYQNSEMAPLEKTKFLLPIPSATYHAVGGDLSIQMWMSRWFQVEAGGTVGKLLGLGEMTAFRNYGAGDGWEWRAYGQLRLNAWGMSLGARFVYDRKEIEFNGTGQTKVNFGKDVTQFIRDENISVHVFLAYHFSPVVTEKLQVDLPQKKKKIEE